MIDMHTHILPGVDDGAEDWEQAEALARAAAAEGITDIIATPHHEDGKFWNPHEEVLGHVQQLNARLQEAGIAIRIHKGQEIRVHKELLANLEKRELATLAGTSYLLLEMPSGEIPKQMGDLIYELNLMNLRPVIAHPERNAEVVRSPDKLQELIDIGAYGQVTTHSLLGGFGRGIEKAAWSLCRNGLIHLVSSDAHQLKWRGFRLKEAYEQISERMGDNQAAYYRGNAARLLRDEELLPAQPAADTAAGQSGWGRLRGWLQRGGG
ncbi:tyrosine-protein phosphatase [Paenibacillus beijingensis]|uniref:Tyrosine-protein phosphatase n=1 Tax=Paenibacillus beijingensis TaxID=1126833 RepID=A0A0D5NHV0_9BACL|nr:CpsB/CapC family capsule biosynthesis tyrosine phosphatase [Paenibacillus beijingensis]AJY74557.1 protein tyrosine phosphatase [Paenibacillus beijingensis]